MHQMVVSIDMRVVFGASGAPTLINDNRGQVASITRLTNGIFQIQLSDNFNRINNITSSFESPLSGSILAGGSLVVGSIYQILTLGSTTPAQWLAAGLPGNLVPTIGQVFKAATVGTGTGTVQGMGVSGINDVEVLGLSATMVNPNPAVGLGGLIIIQTLAPTSPSVTTQIATDPISGSIMKLTLSMLNSSN